MLLSFTLYTKVSLSFFFFLLSPTDNKTINVSQLIFKCELIVFHLNKHAFLQVRLLNVCFTDQNLCFRDIQYCLNKEPNYDFT